MARRPAVGLACQPRRYVHEVGERRRSPDESSPPPTALAYLLSRRGAAPAPAPYAAGSVGPAQPYSSLCSRGPGPLALPPATRGLASATTPSAPAASRTNSQASARVPSLHRHESAEARPNCG